MAQHEEKAPAAGANPQRIEAGRTGRGSPDTYHRCEGSSNTSLARVTSPPARRDRANTHGRQGATRMVDAWMVRGVQDCDLPLFRKSDPVPSKIAGTQARQFKGEHERRILEALAQGPGTKDEIASRCGLTEQQVARRRAGMLRAGLIVLTGERRRTPSGMTAEVWRAK